MLVVPVLNEVELLAVRLQQTFTRAEGYGLTLSEGAFHGPSLLEALDGVGFNEALRRVIPERHNIWEIVNHCAFWMQEAAKAAHGSLIKDVFQSEDWPSHGSTGEDWLRDKDTLIGAYRGLLEAISGLDVKRLDIVIDGYFHDTLFKFTLRKMLYGVIDHNLYHAGQISILKPL